MTDMRNPDMDVVVVGGAAGAVIADKLAQQGKSVALLWRTDIKGATDTNQKWLHSGLLYPDPILAATAWENRNKDWEIKEPYIIKQPSVKDEEQAYILALKEETANQRQRMWENWGQRYNIANWRQLTDDEVRSLNAKGIFCEAGWETPDCVIDFPRMVHDLRQKLLKDTRHRVMKGAKVLKLRPTGNGITEVDGVDLDGQPFTLSCEQCVLAAGAWSYELLRDIGVHLPLIRKKCLVLEIPEKILPVSKITVCLDVTKEDGTYGDVTLVPYKGMTLAAGTDFKVVYDIGERKLEELKCGPSEVAALLSELKQCFTQAGHLLEGDYKKRECVKIERYDPGHPDVNLQVYTDGGGHNVPGLIVAFPGKASLMFDLARTVVNLMVNSTYSP